MKHPPGSQQCKSKSKLSAPQAPFIYMALEPGVIRVPPPPTPIPMSDPTWICFGEDLGDVPRTLFWHESDFYRSMDGVGAYVHTGSCHISACPAF
ncbi:hypothetical protein CDAR_304111 [Caerostris darwini]|uniref:Uncharacterized protein n=1 Tax=Caerostris darwini TaxID=1538125 RepID=A0AAV4WBE3_9ARAC|nr:hypothetical protein CDAR_304111 [Caerostris darwini]